MSRKEDADEAASALAQKKWDKTDPKKRSEHASSMNAARWAGHVAKRPASSRKPAVKKKAPVKKPAKKAKKTTK